MPQILIVQLACQHLIVRYTLLILAIRAELVRRPGNDGLRPGGSIRNEKLGRQR